MKYNIIDYKNENGISPVTGTMILLAVTVIIVVLVSAFALGAFTTPSNTVSAELSYVQTTSNQDLQYQMVSGDSFPLESLTVTYTIKDCQGVFKTIPLDGKAVSPGTRFIAGNLDELKEDTAFLHEFETKETVYLNYMFYNKETGTLVSSGTIAVPGDAT